jgi:diaminohydroxyphosphoribosylaminopyrimidine deaminase/5-amino-6-(5-phosphoribosylamino)uracil reductase
MDLIDDEHYMRIALQLAESAAGQTGINPIVGCVIVNDGRIVGMGAHLKRGEGHAEVHAMEMAGAAAEGATAYVTLEPCCHYGKTPPCSDRLIAGKVARVVIAAKDPNPLVAGQGLERLRTHGIDVVSGVLEREAVRLNEPFNKYIVSGTPFVTLKTASTLDGKIASRTGDSKWITGAASRAFVHTLRHRHQAIMVGVDTVIADDPQLTVRLPVPGIDPIRVVADSMLRIPETAAMLRTGPPVILLASEQAPEERRRRLTALGAEIVTAGSGPRVDLTLAMKLLGEREIGSILLEGGGRLNGAMLEQRLIDKCYLFFAPKIIGGFDAPGSFGFNGFERMNEAVTLEKISVETFDDDICIIGYPNYEAGNSACSPD